MPEGRYRIVAFGQQVGIGVTDSYTITISAVAKRNGPTAPYCVPNELICLSIGRFLGLPIPPCGVASPSAAQTGSWFASLDFNLTGDSLPPVDTDVCVAQLPDLSTGLLVFDVVIANCDRHPSNFSVDFSSSPPRMNIFDHSHALFGFESGAGLQRLTDLRDRLAISGGSHTHGSRHCLLDKLATSIHFLKWVERVRVLPDFLLEDLCRDTIGLGVSEQEAQAAYDFLKHRRDNIATILNDHRSEFTAISQWSLL